MGILSSRQAPSPDAEDILPPHSYKYPAKSGNYFGAHFMMGGERFESAQPESYLFGDNTDLNFLGPRPVSFSYSQPASAEPTRTLQCLTAIRRDSLKFVRASADQRRVQSESKLANAAGTHHQQQTAESTAASSNQAEATPSTTLARPHSVQVDLTTFDESQYNLEFIFDSDAPCSITIYYFATEETGADGLRYISKRPELTSPTYQYEIGANQTFSHSEHIFDPCMYRADELQYNPENEVIPIVIHCVAESPDNGFGPQSHSTLAIVEKSAEGHGFILKPLKQKIYVDGVCYLLQEIYGVENKNAIVLSSTVNTNNNAPGSPGGTGAESRPEPSPFDSSEESGTECVVCMSELRDTLILPCRHLCLCCGCAETLRYKASCCPICRAPFRALLQVKTLRRIRAGVGPVASGGGHHVEQAVNDSSLATPSAPSFLNRYETVALIEALNGPIEAPTVMLPINPIPPSVAHNNNNNNNNTAAVTGTTNPSMSNQKSSGGSSGQQQHGGGTARGTAAGASSGGSGGQQQSRQSGQKRSKGKKTRAPAAIQEVLTPQSLAVSPVDAQHEVTPSPEMETVPIVIDEASDVQEHQQQHIGGASNTESKQAAAAKYVGEHHGASPTHGSMSGRNLIPAQNQHPLCGQLLPGQANDEDDEEEEDDEINNDTNSDEDYVEAHSVAIGEVVTKPELEGPVSEDETEITFESSHPNSSTKTSSSSVRPKTSGRKSESKGGAQHHRSTKESREHIVLSQLDSSPHTHQGPISGVGVGPMTIRGGTETPNSNNSVSSVASTHSEQPLLVTSAGGDRGQSMGHDNMHKDLGDGL